MGHDNRVAELHARLAPLPLAHATRSATTAISQPSRSYFRLGVESCTEQRWAMVNGYILDIKLMLNGIILLKPSGVGYFVKFTGPYADLFVGGRGQVRQKCED